jgi:CRP-like cAMP-binding protein
MSLEQTDCYRMDKDGLNEILQQRPEIAEHISHVLARRKVELDNVRENLDAEGRARMMTHMQKDFFARISKFFGLGSGATTAAEVDRLSRPLGL